MIVIDITEKFRLGHVHHRLVDTTVSCSQSEAEQNVM